MRILGRPESTSSLVSAIPDIPESRAAWRTTTASNQPQRRGRPVVEPNSTPTSRNLSPTSSWRSVGKGPPPTRVVYALEMPSTRETCRGGTPAPVPTAPVTTFDEVTNG